MPFEQRKAEVLSWIRMYDKSKRGLSKKDTTGCSYLGWQRWVVLTVWHKSDAGLQQGPLFFWLTALYIPVLRFRAEFHCSIDIKASVSSGTSEHRCAPDGRGFVYRQQQRNDPHLSSWRKASFWNFHLLLSQLAISTYFVSSEQAEHPDSSWDVSYKKKKKVSWDFNNPWDICLQTSACLCNLTSCSRKAVFQQRFDEPWD